MPMRFMRRSLLPVWPPGPSTPSSFGTSWAKPTVKSMTASELPAAEPLQGFRVTLSGLASVPTGPRSSSASSQQTPSRLERAERLMPPRWIGGRPPGDYKRRWAGLDGGTGRLNAYCRVGRNRGRMAVEGVKGGAKTKVRRDLLLLLLLEAAARSAASFGSVRSSPAGRRPSEAVTLPGSASLTSGETQAKIFSKGWPC